MNAALAPVQVLLRHRGVAVRGGVDARFLNRGGVRAALAWLAVVAAVYFIAVMKTIPVVAGLSVRIARTRECLRDVEQGNLKRRAPAEIGDELGQLERSLNATLEEVSRIIAAVSKSDVVAVSVALSGCWPPVVPPGAMSPPVPTGREYSWCPSEVRQAPVARSHCQAWRAQVITPSSTEANRVRSAFMCGHRRWTS